MGLKTVRLYQNHLSFPSGCVAGSGPLFQSLLSPTVMIFFSFQGSYCLPLQSGFYSWGLKGERGSGSG